MSFKNPTIRRDRNRIGLYSSQRLPLTYCITKAKYGDEPLRKNKSGKEMTNDWLLEDDGKRFASLDIDPESLLNIQIGLVDASHIVEKRLIRTLENGNVVTTKLDKQAKPIK